MLGMRRLLKNVESNSISKSLTRTFFSWKRDEIGGMPNDTVHKPHTLGYLQDQKQICDKYKKSSKFVNIPAGTKLNSFMISGDLLLGATAVYPKESLTKLTKKEYDKIKSWVGNYLSEVETREPIDCISLEEKNGRVVYYIYPGKFKILNMKPVDESVLKGDIAPDSEFQAGPNIKI